MTPGTSPTLAEAKPATDFAAMSARLATGSPTWRNDLRRAEFETFERLGLPTRAHEEWRYTSLAPLTRGAFDAADERPREFDRSAIRAAFVGAADAPRLVFVDGHFDAELSTVVDLGPTQFGELGKSLEGFAPLRDRFAELTRAHEDAVVALSTALHRDGALVFVPRRAEARALEIVHVTGASAPNALAAPRTLVVLEEGARASVLETFLYLGEGTPLALPVTELHVGPNAGLHHQRLVLGSHGALHVASTHARLERGARLGTGFFAYGGALVRDRVVVALAGEGAEVELRGLSTAKGTSHVDCDLLIDHEVPHGTSRQEYRSLIDDRGHSTFHGRVIVRKDAQKAEARQSNRNLLLSPDARADTRPQLEIFADDVQCSHGATIGQLDADAVFYLRSRGLDETFARNLLAHGFANEVVLPLADSALRERVQRELDRFLAATIVTESAQ